MLCCFSYLLTKKYNFLVGWGCWKDRPAATFLGFGGLWRGDHSLMKRMYRVHNTTTATLWCKSSNRHPNNDPWPGGGSSESVTETKLALRVDWTGHQHTTVICRINRVMTKEDGLLSHCDTCDTRPECKLRSESFCSYKNYFDELKTKLQMRFTFKKRIFVWDLLSVRRLKPHWNIVSSHKMLWSCWPEKIIKHSFYL